MKILITGSTGFLGSALIPKLLQKDNEIIALVRDPKKANEILPKQVTALLGDITQPNLGIETSLPLVPDSLMHLAAIHRLGEDKDGSIWETNVKGTENVIAFCKKYHIPHLFFCSSAYTQGRNTYEKSKALCETLVKESSISKVTIFKPSIIMGTGAHFYPGHFSQFVISLIKFHKKADPIRRKIEGTLRLPVLEPRHRVRGNPNGKLNLVQIEQVANAMAQIEDEGTFWLTHPKPPRLGQLVEWISKLVMVRLIIEPEPFKPSLAEMAFHKLTEAFDPYLQGDNFPSDLKHCPRITKKFIHETIKRALT